MLLHRRQQKLHSCLIHEKFPFSGFKDHVMRLASSQRDGFMVKGVFCERKHKKRFHKEGEYRGKEMNPRTRLIFREESW